ncbi:unnamed protein product [Prunus armeniaca]|uniref:Uncharacterized protein n=1 Tax=Prunus armeniaca TaxID=36596 RepID=A0A6J5WTA8_PRUAR|nr:unnamed protein product [Prunus armeniaca]
MAEDHGVIVKAGAGNLGTLTVSLRSHGPKRPHSYFTGHPLLIPYVFDGASPRLARNDYRLKRQKDPYDGVYNSGHFSTVRESGSECVLQKMGGKL